MSIIAKKIEIDFTDDKITSSGGSVFLSQTSSHPGLPQLLDSALGLKVRKRGGFGLPDDFEPDLQPDQRRRLWLHLESCVMNLNESSG